MQWYYIQDGQRVGPHDDEEFARLVNSGHIHGRTLVWHEGMANWQAYLSGWGDQAPAPAPPASTGSTENLPVCIQCGHYGSASDMIPFEDSWVCPDCKEVFFGLVREGMLRPSARRYAGFWVRLVALIIDCATVSGCLLVAVATVFIALPRLETHAKSTSSAILVWGGLGVLWMAYETWMIAAYGATLGKRICRLKVIRPDGRKLAARRAFGRYSAKYGVGMALVLTCLIMDTSSPYQHAVQACSCFVCLVGLVALVGYAMAGLTNQKRALHDMICDTRVIRK
jgi:uncharacterized RDD family membrane protein YckC